MRRGWIVMGGTGEYADCNEWPVAVYADKAAAEKHAAMLNEWCVANGVGPSGAVARRPHHERSQVVCPYDPGFCVDYTGTAYSVAEVEMRDTPPAEAP